ncbi:CPBP family intramembrane glutamic endopeptidase [Staphylococcus caeli]|uniref:Lysostaphin resistance protein A n=1 Tax=Staphylococcus caeli TaxID=2201815 RepID=A0A1D4KY02_9STAP|nr:CPBP family intramembrane glutamic endopeptidase [Staphylococcus caeli]SCS69632.1 Lysostaphin resistance protein A [Staphylococcus caeli]SCS78951.1 Lysostaphin resistance protein A [Staphylococcus caeli]
MNTKRIPGFQWAMMIFIFFIIAYASPIILKDLQSSVPFKAFVFDMSTIAPFIAMIICIAVFKDKATQIKSLKFTISLKVIERLILALILPLIIFIIAMISFNIFADSFVLLQAKDLSVSVLTILIGQLVMAFLVEIGFRSYLQHIVENKMNTFFASIIVGIMYAVWNANIAFSVEFAMFSFLYSFAFSMIIGELIRSTKGRTIYIAMVFHAAMSFGLVFLFNEELGEVFAMKVIALSTVVVAIVYLLLSLIIRVLLYFFTKRNLEEVDENNYLDHVNDDNEDEDSVNTDSTESLKRDQHQADFDSDTTTHSHSPAHSDEETNSENLTNNDTQSHQSEQDASRNNIITENTPNNESIQHKQTDSSANTAVEASTEKAHTDASSDDLKSSARYASNRKPSAVSDAQAEIEQDQHEDTTLDDYHTEDTRDHTHERTTFGRNNKRSHRR